ncbi:MAG: ATP phosphoribosyltransferase regulatory subunit [Ectothiorhodospiraceae bacterium AqS1]|nr:ATP phosphoribosyltransferase regulatory subunit [Ectothiorhodospiraceae bacterium AqS1]
MNEFSRHGEWLSLIEVSGPFLAEPVLRQVFPQGLEQIDPLKRKQVRQAYDEWRDVVGSDDPQSVAIHDAWISLVIKKVLELDADGEGDILKPESELPDSFATTSLEHDVTVRPDFAVIDSQKGESPLMFVAVYEPDTDLIAPVKGKKWAASPAIQMVELCRAHDVRLGLVTNGERWMLVDAPIGGVTSFASWYARLWAQEHITLQAFVNILGIRRFFVDDSERLPTLLDESLKLQEDVTDALGKQVRRAVEVLVQSLDRMDVDRNRELLAGVEPPELYEAALTVLMRIVFLLSAEERGLLLLDDQKYQQHYAVSTLRIQLRGESEEILERKRDAWSRLLAIFRAVFGGIEHDALHLPALGGSLFDPDRFPFLEGRAKGTSWRDHPAVPLPIDNRTVLLLLDAVQLFEGRTLSYRALDVEQIGYVYEGLLECTVIRAHEVTLDLKATKNAKTPWVTLDDLEIAASDGEGTVRALIEDRTGSSTSRVKKYIEKQADEATSDRLLSACQGDQNLRDRIKPYLNFLRMDRWGYPLVYSEGTFMVTAGADRRETGTHYTPKSLTEAIVKETLEPIVYIGPVQGKLRENWILRSPSELLDIKICDPAMGSGAFLVQVCRWLSERLVEAWSEAESAGKAITAEGNVVDNIASIEPLRTDLSDRLLTAQRLIAERCLYGVDINPLAVELAKLSIWLVTLAKGRPFGFLDHNFRTGDSLLGIHSLDQLLCLDMKPRESRSKRLFAKEIDQAVESAIGIRTDIRSHPIRDIRDVHAMAAMDEKARAKLELPVLIADALIGDVLVADGKSPNTVELSIEAGDAIAGDGNALIALKQRAKIGLEKDTSKNKSLRRPFHWPLEFPELFLGTESGFDAIVGNPPFLGGQKITGAMGTVYREYLVEQLAEGTRGSADLVSYFFLTAFSLLAKDGIFGLLAVNTIAEGNTREVGLNRILAQGGTIVAAYPNENWPGTANVVTSRVHLVNGEWNGVRSIARKLVTHINSYLGTSESWIPVRLSSNLGLVFQGSTILGNGFLLTKKKAEIFLQKDSKNKNVIYPYLIGREINQNPEHVPARYVINFFDSPKKYCEEEYPDILNLLRERVKSERQNQKNDAAKKNWWLHLGHRPELYHAIGRGHSFFSHPRDWKDDTRRLSSVIVLARAATKYPCFTLVPNTYIYADSTCVLASESYAMIACLSSDLHVVWAWQYSSKMNQRLRYTHSDIFETFPFPDGVLSDEQAELTDLGKKFFNFRREYMIANDKGMTKFYNDFHNPTCSDAAIIACRNIQRKINDAVLVSYGFDDIDLDIGFHQVGYLPPKKNTCYTMSEGARQEILFRLALLNKERHEGETGSAGKRNVIKGMSSINESSELFSLQGDAP